MNGGSASKGICAEGELSPRQGLLFEGDLSALSQGKRKHRELLRLGWWQLVEFRLGVAATA